MMASLVRNVRLSQGRKRAAGGRGKELPERVGQPPWRVAKHPPRHRPDTDSLLFVQVLDGRFAIRASSSAGSSAAARAFEQSGRLPADVRQLPS
jgi:hypothetical protein